MQYIQPKERRFSQATFHLVLSSENILLHNDHARGLLNVNFCSEFIYLFSLFSVTVSFGVIVTRQGTAK